MPSKKTPSRTQNKISRREFGGLAAGGVLLGGSGALTTAAKAATTDAAKAAKLDPTRHRGMEFLLGRSRARDARRRHLAGGFRQADVRRVSGPRQSQASVPDRTDPRRRRLGPGLDGHGGWPQGLVHDAAGRRLPGVCGGPAGSRPLALSSRSARRNPSRPDARKHLEPVHSAAGEGAGPRRRAAGSQRQAAQPMAGHGRGRLAGAVPVGGVAGRVVRQRDGHHQGIAGGGVAEGRRGAAG